MKNQKTKGFKGFKKGLKCRDKQYAENADFEEDVKPVACSIGMHFCENPLDVFNYYPPSGQNEYAEVESIGDSVKKEDKTVTNKLSIKSKISIAGLFKMHFASIFKGIEASPSTINTSGYEAHANTSGYEAHANTSGDHAHANTSGDYAYANTSGDEAVASATGYGSRAKAKKGWIIIVDWGEDENRNRYIIDIKRAKVGKHKIQNIKIEPDTWYWFENGKLKSEKACKSS